VKGWLAQSQELSHALAQPLQNDHSVLAVRQLDGNLFCSEQLRDAELMLRTEGRMGALPSVQSKLTGEQASDQQFKL
jgi:hypothetical protein